jgi:hypothetical protein
MPIDKDTITLWAEAKKLGIEGYRKLELAELRKLIANAKTGDTPAKGKVTARATNGNGAKGKASATTVVKGKAAGAKVSTPATKGKATSTAKRAPAVQSTARKSSPTKATAAQGKATRPATGGKGKATVAKATGRTTATAKPVTRTTRGAQAESYAVRIDNKAVNWKAEWGGGSTGKRGVVLDALRTAKGDKDAVFAAVKRYSVKWYPDKEKADADKMVRWLIGRVALDFVKATGQHESGVRAAYGTSEKPNDVRRREARAATRPKTGGSRSRREVTGTIHTPKAAGKGKSASAARKPAATRTAAAKGKTAPATKGKAVVAKGKGR